jgi:AraC-like DNA-binding protein
VATSASFPQDFLLVTGFELRLLYCGRYPCPPDWSIEKSRLPDNMIGFFFVEKGECWSVVNGRRLSLRRGHVQVLRGGELVSMGHDSVNPLTALSVGLSLGQGTVANVLLHRAFRGRYVIRNIPAYIAAFEVILQALQSPVSIRDWATGGAVLRWLALLQQETAAQMMTPAETSGKTVDKVIASQDWIVSRLEQPTSLVTWARAVDWHPVYFERVFRQATGITPMQWLRERRLQMACQYLRSTSKSIAEIASEVGYTDPFHFSRAFKSKFGKSPFQYRKADATRQGFQNWTE